MFLTLPLLAAACVPVGTTPPVAGQSALPAIEVPPWDTVTFERRSWGILVHRWTIDRSGHVDHVRDDTPFGGPATSGYQVRKTLLMAGQIRALTAAFARIDNIMLRPEGCASRVTDGPYGTLSWQMGARKAELTWSANCVNGRDADLTAAVGAVDKIVDDAALATPVLEVVPEGEDGRRR